MESCTRTTGEWRDVRVRLVSGELYAYDWSVESCTRTTGQWRVVRIRLVSGEMYAYDW